MKPLFPATVSLRIQITAALVAASVLGALAAVLVIELLRTTATTTDTSTLLTLAGLLGMTVWMSYLAARQMLAPIADLGQTSANIAANAEAQFPLCTTPELAPLIQAFNASLQDMVKLRHSLDDMVVVRTQALARSETRLSHVLNVSDEGFLDWDLSTNQVQINLRCCQLLELSESVLSYSSETFFDRLNEQDRLCALDVIRTCLKRDTPYHGELQIKKRDGTPLWLIIHGSVIERQANGRATRVIGSISNITERYLSQQALQDKTIELNTIMDLSPDGFVALGPSNHVRYVSKAFTRMTGLDGALFNDLDETDFWSRLRHDCLTDYLPTVRGAESTNAADPSSRVLLSLEYPDRRVMDVTRRKSQTGAISQILCFRDVTHETEVARLKSEFMSTAAYELRTPLASIYGFAEILLNFEHDASARREFLEIIYRQAHVMSLLLNELLDLSRIESRSEKDFHPVDTSVQALVEDIANSFNLPPNRNAPVISTPNGKLTMHVDINKARQSILNVLSNAYKYSGGEVYVVIDQVSATNGAAMVSICITDQGIGMTPQQASQIFERFYRANRTSKIPGSGLGMSIVKEIADLHGGSVTVDSTPGQGTSISLLFPAVSNQSQD